MDSGKFPAWRGGRAVDADPGASQGAATIAGTAAADSARGAQKENAS
jgi:hypothetical protein